jgi:hypothetical protein
MRPFSIFLSLLALGVSMIVAIPTSGAFQCGTFTIDKEPELHTLQYTGKNGCLPLLPSGKPAPQMSILRHKIEKGYTCATY